MKRNIQISFVETTYASDTPIGRPPYPDHIRGAAGGPSVFGAGGSGGGMTYTPGEGGSDESERQTLAEAFVRAAIERLGVQASEEAIAEATHKIASALPTG